MKVDKDQTPGQLRARIQVRLDIARQDESDSLSFHRNMAEAARLERLLSSKENGL